MPEAPPGAAARRAGLILDERCLTHVNPAGVPAGGLPAWAPVDAFERPERLSLTKQVLEGSGVLDHVVRRPAREATPDELWLAHTPQHVTGIVEAARAGEPVKVGDEAWVGPGSLGPALLGAGALVDAVGAVLDGELDTAFVVARPPGHHCGPASPMGFCLFNPNAVGARWAQAHRGLERVAVLDWDVHHGNGTEEVFWDDGSVLTVSLHQQGLYPAGRGELEARGTGDGEGRNVNVPLPAFTGDDGYALAWERVVVPAVRSFAPQLILVGAGQDAAASDPLGRMGVTVPGFRALADAALSLADECCDGRLVAFLEGGYSLMHTPLANLAILEALAGLPPTFTEDPVGCDVPLGVSGAAEAAIEVAARVHAQARA
jgi:acetoin utilization deacetylase AcuC-like enzyme